MKRDFNEYDFVESGLVNTMEMSIGVRSTESSTHLLYSMTSKPMQFCRALESVECTTSKKLFQFDYAIALFSFNSFPM